MAKRNKKYVPKILQLVQFVVFFDGNELLLKLTEKIPLASTLMRNARYAHMFALSPPTLEFISTLSKEKNPLRII